jgi:hypothetical protein
MVWSHFPYDSKPNLPGPIRHAAVIVGAFEAREGAERLDVRVPSYGMVVGVYTSSQIGKFEGANPVGVIQVPLERARQNKNNSAFFIDTRIRAFLPFHKTFFPDIESEGHGLIASLDRGLWKRIQDEYMRVNERYREQVVEVGPLRPGGPGFP